MKVKVTQDFNGVPDGAVYPRLITKGEVIEGTLAKAALAEKWGTKVKGSDKDPDDDQGDDETPEGGAGDETPEGGAGDETPEGGAGDETPEGGAGDDTVEGGAGDDTVVGGDLLGSAADTGKAS